MESSSPSTQKNAMTMLGVMVGLIAAYLLTQKFLFPEPTFDQQLISIANDVNTSCPLMVDAATRMDNAMALPGTILQYNYTLIDTDKTDIDTTEAKSHMKSHILQHIKTSPQMAPLREKRVNFNYHYSDMYGNHLFLIHIPSKDYQ